MKVLSRSALCAIAFVATGCFSGSDEQVYKIVASQDLTVTTADNRVVEVKKGNSIPVAQSPVYLEAPGYIGLLVLPPLNGNGEVTANLRPFDQWGGADFERRSNQVLGDVVDGLVNAQKMMARNQASTALSEVERLIGKYPTISYLNFIKASCLVMLGQKREAIVALEVALRDHPQHAQGKNLYRDLSGKDYQEALAH